MLHTHLDPRPERRHGRPPPFAALLGVVIGLGVGGCEDYGPRVYTAAPWRAEQGCLGTYAPIGVVRARDLGSECAAICLRSEDTLYVSTVCAPYPSEATIEPADAGGCAAAVEALVAGDYCQPAAADAAAP